MIKAENLKVSAISIKKPTNFRAIEHAIVLCDCVRLCRKGASSSLSY